MEEVTGRRRIKKPILILGILLVLALMVSCVVYAVSEDSVFHHLLSKPEEDTVLGYFFSGQEGASVKELIEDSNQTVEIDDYTITLRQAMAESKTQVGYCIFEVTKKGGEPEVNFAGGHTLNGGNFGEDSRFGLWIPASHEIKGKTENDKLILYYYFSGNDPRGGEKGGAFQNEIILIDHKYKDISTSSDCKEYTFSLPETTKGKQYAIDENASLYISPLGVIIRADRVINDHKIEIVTADGKSKVLIDTKNSIGVNGCNGGDITVSEEGTEAMYTYRFLNLVDVDNISTLIFNGKEL